MTDRFMKYVMPVPECGCFVWLGEYNSNGYGRFRVGRKWILAHRFAYSQAYGAIPYRLDLDHVCRVRGCVNPAHLEPVTRRENLLRGTGFVAVNARKTHCPQGHEFNAENTYYPPRTNRIERACRACRREQQKRWKERRGPHS